MLWTVQLLDIYFPPFRDYFLAIDKTLDKLDTYLLLYFFPADYIFERKGALDPPPPPTPPFPLSPKKVCLYCITGFFQIFCAKSHFFPDFSMMHLPKYKIKILCVSTIVLLFANIVVNVIEVNSLLILSFFIWET